MPIIPVDPNTNKFEKFDIKRNKEQNEAEIRLHEQSFEKTSGTESLKTFEGNNDFPLYDRIKGSFVDLKMSQGKRDRTLKMTNDLGYKMNLNFGDEKSKSPEVNKKFLILSIVDVVSTLNLEKNEKSDLRDGLMEVQNLNEGNDKELHYTEAIDDPDYPILKGLEKNDDLKLTPIETKAIGEQLSSTENIKDAITKVLEEVITPLRKQEILSVIDKIHKELSSENREIPAIFGLIPGLSIKEGESNEIVKFIGSNYIDISGKNDMADVNTALNISLNKIIHNKVIPNRYSELMQQNINTIRNGTNVRDKVQALKVIYLNVNGALGFTGKAMDKVKGKIEAQSVIDDEKIDEMYRKVLGILKKHSKNEENSFNSGIDASKLIQMQIAAEEEKEKAGLDGDLFDIASERSENNSSSSLV